VADEQLIIYAKILRKADDPNWTIALAVHTSDGAELTIKELQTGYADPGAALDAYMDALTYAAPPPPDMGIYDIGLTRVGQLVDQMGDVTEAIPQIVQRLEDAEEAIKAGVGPATTAPVKRINPLLAGKDAAAVHAAQPKPPTRPPPPAIRRVPADAAVRVHGSYAGGPMAGRHVAAPEPDMEGED
jgi:hypothetical protein